MKRSAINSKAQRSRGSPQCHTSDGAYVSQQRLIFTVLREEVSTHKAPADTSTSPYLDTKDPLLPMCRLQRSLVSDVWLLLVAVVHRGRASLPLVPVMMIKQVVAMATCPPRLSAFHAKQIILMLRA